MIILGKNINLRTANIDDAAFILDLRLSKGEFLSQTSQRVEDQIEWLKKYKGRELGGLEYYFIIESKNSEKLGIVRVYNLLRESFCWGSWIIKDNAPFYTAIQSALLIYEFAFYKLNYERSEFDVRKNNEKVIKFHQIFGAKIISEDNLNYYFSYEEKTYKNIKKKYSKYL